jgi:PAS domain S-box-containing protein
VNSATVPGPLLVAFGVLALLLAGAGWAIVRLSRELGRLRGGFEARLQERDAAEHARRQSEGFYLSLVENLPQNIFRKDPQGRFTFANKRFCESLGRDLADVLGKTDHDFYPDSLADKYRRDDLHVMETDQSIDDVEEHVTLEGQTRYVQVTKTPLHDANGQVAGLQCIFWDVTQQRQAVEALALSEERFALAMLGANDGLWDWDLRTNDAYYSPRFKELLGFADDEFIDRLESLGGRLNAEDRPGVEEATRRHLNDREPFHVECRLRDRAGEDRWFLIRGQAVWDESGRATRMVGSISDIDARKTAEELLRTQNQLLQEMAHSVRSALDEREQAQSRMVENAKLAGLGQLVAGVAHEINNPLAFVSNNVAVLERDLHELKGLIDQYRSTDAVLAEHLPELAACIAEQAAAIDLDYTLGNLGGLLERTRDGLRRIRDIVKDLRVFARLDESDLAEADLASCIESTTNIIRGYARRKHVNVVIEPGELAPLLCYPAKINQVLTNLLVNAIDASPEGGEVTIRSMARGQMACIEVVDRGTGIDAAIRDRIFDPFFTTKPVGEGTGLGLSISYGIVQDHGGRIEVDSEPSRGTTFRVLLPQRCAAARGAAPASSVGATAAPPA